MPTNGQAQILRNSTYTSGEPLKSKKLVFYYENHQRFLQICLINQDSETQILNGINIDVLKTTVDLYETLQG